MRFDRSQRLEDDFLCKDITTTFNQQIYEHRITVVTI